MDKTTGEPKLDAFLYDYYALIQKHQFFLVHDGGYFPGEIEKLTPEDFKELTELDYTLNDWSDTGEDDE